MNRDPRAELDAIRWPYTEHGEWLHTICPICERDGQRDKSVSIHATTGAGKCLHATCVEKWGLAHILKKAGKKTTPPKGGIIPADFAAHYGITRGDYAEHGCKVQTVKFKEFPQGVQAIVYPLILPSGKKTNGKARSIERTAKGKRAAIHLHQNCGCGFFPPANVKGKGTLVLVAGEEKALALIKAGFRALSYSAGEGSITKAAAEFLKAKGNDDVFVRLDSGEETTEGGPKWEKTLRDAGIKNVHVGSWPDGTPDKHDVNDVLRDKGIEAVKALVESTIAITQKLDKGEWDFEPVKWTELMKKDFPPLVWIIENLLPEGLAVIAGPPKLGKTILLTLIAAHVGTGRDIFGFKTHQACVLYIDAEQSDRGIQRRLINMGWPDGALNCESFSPPPAFQLDDKGLRWLDRQKKQNPNLKLVIVDTLERLIPSNTKNTDSYRMDVNRLSAIQKWASENYLCVLCVHHDRKNSGKRTKTDESYDAISGSRGITGTAETLFSVTRVDGNTFRVDVVSRSMAGLTIALRRVGLKWSIATDIDEATMTPERKTLLAYFESVLQATIQQAAIALGWDLQKTKQQINRAYAQGQLIKNQRGIYMLNPERRTPPITSVTLDTLENDKVTEVMEVTGGLIGGACEHDQEPDPFENQSYWGAEVDE